MTTGCGYARLNGSLPGLALYLGASPGYRTRPLAEQWLIHGRSMRTIQPSANFPAGRDQSMKSEIPMKKPPAKSATEPGESTQSSLDLSIVSALAKIAGHHDLSEVEIEHDGLRVRVARERRAAAPVSYTMAAPVAAAAPADVAAPASASHGERPGAVKSPMVGTAYLRASPEAKPFIEVGSIVKAGDKILLVEAMKTFNEIVAPKAGKVVDIFVEDGSPVEYGQTLLIIE
jgi:acetyl-CoA carboxylase biotin carboxyl carrier protein